MRYLWSLSALVLLIWLASCSPMITPVATIRAVATEKAAGAGPDGAAVQSPQPEQTAVPAAQTEMDEPSGVPEINPLTGKAPKNPSLLARRPILIKVENLPRENRPQWGLSSADLVYEYYTEEGSTRFAALFYGQDAEKVGPIRSARWFDIQLMRMYKPFFVFGSAYQDLLVALGEAEFSSQLLLEQPDSCPAICRYEPNGRNFLLTSTAALQGYVASLGKDNSPQALDGMLFRAQAPPGGEKVEHIFTRFSGAIYNRWDYDAKTGRYWRFSDAKDDVNRNRPVYQALTDRLTGQQIAADNVVVLLAEYIPLVRTEEAEVNDINLSGRGKAFLARDGRLYEVQWQRQKPNDVLTLVDEQGQPFPFKPGQTWFEVMGLSTVLNVDDKGWQFIFLMP